MIKFKNVVGLFIIIIVLGLCSCNNEWDYDYPFVKSNSLLENGDQGVLFTGEISKLGNEEIIEYGCAFHLSLYGDFIYIPAKKVENEEGDFKVELGENILRENQVYYFLAYAKTEDYIVFSEKRIEYECTFPFNAEIVSISPLLGTKEDKRVIKVKNLCIGCDNEIIIFNDLNEYIYKFAIIDDETIELDLTLLPWVLPGTYKIGIINGGYHEFDEEIVITE